jgi:hypothetical protein
VWEGLLEPRRQRRAAGAFEVAVGRAVERLNTGEAPREDGFISNDDSAPGWELLEGAMVHAASAYQERKVPYIGFLWSSLLFRPDISPDYGHYLTGLVDRLTYRQLVAIAFIAEQGQGSVSRRTMVPSFSQAGPWAKAAFWVTSRRTFGGRRPCRWAGICTTSWSCIGSPNARRNGSSS